MQRRHARRFVMGWLLALLALACGTAVAEDEFVLVQQLPGPNAPNLLKTSSSARSVTTLAMLSRDFYIGDLVLAEDNRTVLAIGYQGYSISHGAIWAVSPNGATSLWGMTRNRAPRPITLLRTGDGDWRLFSQDATLSQLLIHRLRGGNLTTLAVASTIQPVALAEDPETGLIVVRGTRGYYPNWFPGYYAVDPASGAVTTFARPTRPGFNVYHGAHEPLFDRVRGGFLDVIYDDTVRGMELTHVDPVLGIRQLTYPAFVMYPYDVVRSGGRSWPAAFTVLARRFTIPVTYYFFTLGHDGKPLGYTELPIEDALPAFAPMVRLGGRPLTWFMDKRPNGRRLQLDFPGEAGRRYVVGLSVSGVRPGIRLSDGRTVPIRFDAITYLGLIGGVPGVLEGATGTLDQDGRAAMKLDTNRLGAALKGVVVWSAAIVIDPAAPSGVADIAGPTRVVFSE